MPMPAFYEEVFVHRYLWEVVTRILDAPSGGTAATFHDDLVVMIFSFHTLEAYLNAVGGILSPELWKIERDYFAKPPYQGFDGKMRKVFERCNLRGPQWPVRPYASVWKLNLLRESIAHARPETDSDILLNSTKDMTYLHKEPFQGMVTHENALVAAKDTAELIRMIHAHARKKADAYWLRHDPLDAVAPYGFPGTTSRQ